MPRPTSTLPQHGETFPDGPEAWRELLENALASAKRKDSYLALAEAAERACPGDPHILSLAATAALLDGRAEKAQTYLKRYSKRYEQGRTWNLLTALALGQQNKAAAARDLLQRYALTDWATAWPVFPGGAGHRSWLMTALDTIMGRKTTMGGTRAAQGQKPSASPGTAKPVAGKGAAAKSVARPIQLARPPAGMNLPDAPAPALPALARLEVEIPMAVEAELTAFLSSCAGQAETEGTWFNLRARLAHLELAEGFDELLCLPHLRGIETFWYQTETVRKVLKQFRGRVLLADEVGLGKTVEAGMVLKEYLLRGMVARALILVPATLVGQWREELETKFGIPSISSYDPLLRDDPAKFWASSQIIIASLPLARRSEHAALLCAQSFDLVIVDEAHHLRDNASASYKLVDGLTKRFLLLLSATPVQNNLIELYNLLTLLKPGIFKTQKEFRAQYMVAGKPRQPANSERLRDLMRDAMIRNTRAVVALKLPRRNASTRHANADAGENSAYQELAAMVRALAADGQQSRYRLAMHHLVGAAGSSPAAAAAAIARFAARQTDSAPWQQLAARWTALGPGAKETALLELLARNPTEKKLVFIHHRETMASLADLLSKAGIAFARFEGGMSGPAKDAAIADFRERVGVLLCSESGGEGRNIQFCNTLINFDIPWNPMAIEQRIGRIDRIGQTREVFVFNLVTRGTADEQVLRLLDEKINMFELVVGEAGAILGELEEERGFAELVLDAWLETTEAGRIAAFDDIGRRLDEALHQYSGAKALDDALFGEDFETA
jgi:superfamily II DNA or RNA helicase